VRELVSYTCTSCGGALIVDRNEKVLACPFCGNAFDVVLMHRKELLGDAATNMQHMEFNSAKEKFESILTGDPNDFEALRGLVLCDGKLRSVNTLQTPEKMKVCSFDNMQNSLEKIVNRAKEEDIPYFKKLSEMVTLAEEHLKISNKKTAIPDAAKEEYRRFTDQEEGIFRLYFTYHLITILIAIFIFWFGNPVTAIYVELGALGGFIPIYLICKFVVKKKFEQKHHAKMAAISGEEHEMDARLADIEAKYAEALDELEKLEPATQDMKAPVYSPMQNGAEE